VRWCCGSNWERGTGVVVLTGREGQERWCCGSNWERGTGVVVLWF
jgi:hypothetical protein